MCSVASVRMLIGLKVNIGAVDVDGHTAMWYAVSAASVDTTRQLLAAGANTELQNKV